MRCKSPKAVLLVDLWMVGSTNMKIRELQVEFLDHGPVRELMAPPRYWDTRRAHLR
jgi:hypothetical protein